MEEGRKEGIEKSIDSLNWMTDLDFRPLAESLVPFIVDRGRSRVGREWES